MEDQKNVFKKESKNNFQLRKCKPFYFGQTVHTEQAKATNEVVPKKSPTNVCSIKERKISLKEYQIMSINNSDLQNGSGSKGFKLYINS